MKRNKERLIWLGISVFLTAFIIILTISPQAIAQSRSGNSQQYLNMFSQVFDFIQENYVEKIDPEELFEGAMEGLFDSLDDPHSAYLGEEELRVLTDTTTGEFGGIGIYIDKQVHEESENGKKPEYVEVISPIEDTPAYRAGLHSGDLITKIEGVSTDKYTIDEVVDKLRGRPGSEVTITIQRGASVSFEVSLTREMIRVPTVKMDMIDPDIGYLRIIQFTPYTDDRVKEAIRYFEENNYSNMVIDLRSNSGGLYESVVDTADLFFSDGVIVGTASRVESENEVSMASPGIEVPESLPIAVLINAGTASAAEILAGAMKDKDRATLLGEKSYGKGSVQQVRSIGDGGFRLTISRYYTPDGTFIDKKGIIPDYEITEAELTKAEEEAYAQLIEKNRIENFVDEHPQPENWEVNAFVQQLKEEGVELREIMIKRMVRNEVNRRMDKPPLYNLELDPVLKRAVEMLRKGEIETGK